MSSARICAHFPVFVFSESLFFPSARGFVSRFAIGTKKILRCEDHKNVLSIQTAAKDLMIKCSERFIHTFAPTFFNSFCGKFFVLFSSFSSTNLLHLSTCHLTMILNFRFVFHVVFVAFCLFKKCRFLFVFFGIVNPHSKVLPVFTSAAQRMHVTSCQTSEKSFSHLAGAFPDYMLFFFLLCCQMKHKKKNLKEALHM